MMFLQFNQKDGFSVSELGETWKEGQSFQDWLAAVGYKNTYTGWATTTPRVYEVSDRYDSFKTEVYANADGSYLCIYDNNVDDVVCIQVANGAEMMALRITMAPMLTAENLALLLTRSLEVQERLLRVQHDVHDLESVCSICDPEARQKRVEEAARLRAKKQTG